MKPPHSRRDFLHVTLAGVAAAACSKSHAPPSNASAGAPPSGSKPPEGPPAGAPKEGDVALRRAARCRCARWDRRAHQGRGGQEPERVFGDDGAIAALLAAKKAGKIRFLGFTGHKAPAIHLHISRRRRKELREGRDPGRADEEDGRARDEAHGLGHDPLERRRDRAGVSALAVAYAFQPMPQPEIDALPARTAKVAGADIGKYERFKTSEAAEI